ncbi:MAG: CARDB domain-containing protein, partial [Gammaproteobacteria bacterium]
TVSNAAAANTNTPASTLTYYRYTDATLATVAETFTDTVSIPAIAAGTSATTDTSVSLTAPSTAGSYYYGACMPTTGNDTDASNNCASATVTAVVPAWDLSASNITAPATAPLPDAFDLSATVSNAATANFNSPADATLRFYRSDDSTMGGSNDSTISSVISVTPLAPGANQVYTVSNWGAVTQAGDFWFYACISDTNGADSSNDCTSLTKVARTGSWDLSLLLALSASTVVAGDAITLTTTVHNFGAVASPATTMTYFLNDNGTFTSPGSEMLESVAPNTTLTFTLETNAPATAGEYSYHASLPASGLINEGDLDSSAHEATASLTVTAASN